MTDILKIDFDEFDKRTGKKWFGEQIEFLKCQGCDQIFLSLPDSHLVLTNPLDLTETSSCGTTKKSKCPKCKSVWHDGKNKWLTEQANVDEIRASLWAWVEKQ